MQTRRRTRHGLVIALVALLGSVASLLVPASPAQATSTIICKGFTACQASGHSSFGYGPTNYKKMWWRMYAGHNCTNYMSYRMIQAGMSSTRPWSGSGDARNWGVVFRSRTNQTPLVGSVAWWSSNHVAYVQQIIDANTIIISEDHYGGDFDWRRIVRSGGGWPTGFIHLVDEAVTPTAPPTVTGTPQVDEPLAVSAGRWNRTGVSYTYQWLANGRALPGATLPSYVPTPAQVGSVFTVKVSASKVGYRTGTSTSAATPATVPGTMQVSGDPTIAGIAKVGAVLTATVPTFSPQQDSTQYAWFADGVFIPGGSGTSITLKPAQLGRTIRFSVTAKRVGYDDAVAGSLPTAKVLPEKLSVIREPQLLADPLVGKPLSVTPGAVAPTAVTTYQWFRDGIALPGATTPTYTPTTSDPGTRLTVTVSYTRDGYTTIVRELRARHQVRSVPRFGVRSLDHHSVTVTVVADGIPTVYGEVTLVARNGKTMTMTLKRGKATFVADWLYQGARQLKVTYRGSYRVQDRTITRTVQVQ